MLINEIEFEFDAYDAEQVEKASEEMKKVVDSFEKVPENLDRLQSIKYTVKTVSNCFDNIFGDGSSEKIFKGKSNMKVALKAFEQLTAGIKEQDVEFEKELKKTTEKYSPNRATRRNSKSKK